MPRKSKVQKKPKTLKRKKPSSSSSAAQHYGSFHKPSDKKSRFSDLEKQFEFPDLKSTWQDKGKNQKVLGTDYITIESVSPIQNGAPRVVEFELRDNEEIWGMGRNTRFKIKGKFQYAEEPEDGKMPEWENCTAAEVANVIVQPNWVEAHHKMVEFYHGQSNINSSSEVRHVPAWLNCWKYAMMNPDQKKLLCPQPSCSGFGVPTKKDSWTFAAESEWVKTYGPAIFNGNQIFFDHVLMDMAPLYQGTNYMAEPQNILPMPVLDKITIRFSFIEDLSAIFNIRATVTKKYRFYYDEIKLVVERIKLNPSAKSTLLSKRGKWDYAGVTRIMKTENIMTGELIHKARIQNMLLPEGLFIFALPKKVLNGTYTYQGSTGNVFTKHHIKSVDIKYGDLQMFVTRPNLGMIQNDVIESKLFTDYMTAAPFGLNMDPAQITVGNIENGWSNTPYPHVYINLCNFGDKSRIVPYLNDGSMLKFENDMELTLNFDLNGAVGDNTYIIYYFYTDNNLTLDTSHKNQSFFKSPYIRLV
jgi:hypothetical protein